MRHRCTDYKQLSHFTPACAKKKKGHYSRPFNSSLNSVRGDLKRHRDLITSLCAACFWEQLRGLRIWDESSTPCASHLPVVRQVLMELFFKRPEPHTGGPWCWLFHDTIQRVQIANCEHAGFQSSEEPMGTFDMAVKWEPASRQTSHLWDQSRVCAIDCCAKTENTWMSMKKKLKIDFSFAGLENR